MTAVLTGQPGVPADFLEPGTAIPDSQSVALTGAPGTAAAAGVAGTVVAQQRATVTGTAATATATSPAGTVLAVQRVTLTGAAGQATATMPPGSVSTGQTASVTITGVPGTATAATPAGTVLAVRRAVLTGQPAAATASSPAGTVYARDGTGRELTWDAGTPLFRWSAGTPLILGGPTVPSHLSTDHWHVRVSARIGDIAIDPTTDPVAMAITPYGQDPAVADWHTADWDVIGGTPYARLLVGPEGGAVTLTPGRVTVHVRVTDNPEVPVLRAGDVPIT